MRIFEQGDYENAFDTIKILEQKIRESEQRIRDLQSIIEAGDRYIEQLREEIRALKHQPN